MTRPARRVLKAAWRLTLALALVCLTAFGAAAQSGEGRDRYTEAGLPDYAAWSTTAQRAEQAIDAGRASTPALERLRSELTAWRELFLAAEGHNGARIATVRGRLEALGAATGAPEGENAPAAALAAPEAATVAARRAALQDRLAEMRAPGILAADAFAQANGLVAEIDGMIRARQTAEVSARGPTLLRPAPWTDGMRSLWRAAEQVGNELHENASTRSRAVLLRDVLPQVAVAVLLAVILLLGSGRLTEWCQRQVRVRSNRGRGVWSFVISLMQVVFPVLGVLLLAVAADSTGLAGFRANRFITILPAAGLMVALAHWLADRFFPDGEDGGPLAFMAAGRARGRSLVRWLGWIVALRLVLEVVADTGEAAEAARGAILFPVHFLAAAMLYRFGSLLVQPLTPAPGEEEAEMRYRGRIVVLAGHAIRAIAVAGPVLAVLGYGAAANELIYPAVMTLGVLGVVLLLQRLVYDLYTLISNSDEGASDALAPVLIAFALILLALPVVALIWGARVADLTELWARFREGFAIGETRLSPTDFLTFAAVFAVGYVATRLVQGGLRNSVLPKTNLDIGGQNAIVAGLGYIGIFLAAVVAITMAGIDLSSLAIVAGALSVGIGFGLQTIVSNFVSGIILLIERPISEGDWIQVGDQMGYVRDISVRATRIETFDRTDVIIPNADLVSGQVTNWTRGNSVGRAIVPVGVAYGTDTGRVTEILREIAESNPMVILNPPPAVLFRRFGADALEFEIRAILRDVNWVLNVTDEINHAIARRFAEEGIEVPFAQRDLWLRNPEALHPKAQATPPKAQPAETPHLQAEDMDRGPGTDPGETGEEGEEP